MKPFTDELGDRNIIGVQMAKIRAAKKMDVRVFCREVLTKGFDMTPPSVLKIEAQIKKVTDREILAIARALDVPIADLFPEEDAENS